MRAEIQLVANRMDRERMSHLLLEVTPNLVALFADVNKVLIKHLTRCTKKLFHENVLLFILLMCSDAV